MNYEQTRRWACTCGEPVLMAKVTQPSDVNIDVHIEIGKLICPKCRRQPQLVELVLDRQPKVPSRIVVPGRGLS